MADIVDMSNTTDESACLGCCWTEIAVILVLITIIYHAIMRVCFPSKPVKLKGEHVIITGGSKGIGLAVIHELAAHEDIAAVTILARNIKDLDRAKKKVHEAVGDKVQVATLSVDATDYAAVQKAVDNAVKQYGPIGLAIACAGLSVPGYFLEQDVSVFAKTMEVNYMGTVHFTKAVAPFMCAQRKGAIVLVSSSICAGTFMGYASYAPTKFAVRGLADTLRNELIGFNVSVHVSFPPDTETPGYEAENKTKPPECSAITPPESYTPRAVAKDMVKRLKRGDYLLLSLNFESNMSLIGNAGTQPRSSMLFDACVAGPFMLAQQQWRAFHADKIARKYGESAKKNA